MDSFVQVRTQHEHERYSSMWMIPTKSSSRKKRGRILSSPTGKTPSQPSKRGQFQDQTLQRQAWTEEERQFLKDYILDIGAVPHVGATSFWNDCAASLNKQFGTSRNGNMCRSSYLKLSKSLFDSKSKTAGTQTGSFKQSVEAQTQPAIPITQGKRNHANFLGVSTWDDMTVPEDDSDHAIQHTIIKFMQSKTDFDVGQEKTELLETILNNGDIAKKILELKGIRRDVERYMMVEMEEKASRKCCRSAESYLYPKGYTSLLEFSFENCVTEFMDSLPFLMRSLIAVALPSSRVMNCRRDVISNFMPKLALIYSIVMCSRFHELSRLQRTVSVALMDSHAQEKVFDRLEKLGISTSYQGATRLTEEIGQHNLDMIINSVKEGKKFRIIGDNINIRTGVRHERISQHGSMINWFASALIIQRGSFGHLPHEPQGLSKDLSLQAFLPTPDDEFRLLRDYSILIAQVAAEHLPQLDFLSPLSKEVIQGEYPEAMKERSFTVALPVLPLNEQKYSDTVQILASYEDTVTDIYDKAGVGVQSVHIGGDQLTRERFTGAKGLRSACHNETDRFEHLGPITFEFWHTAMNFLLLIFKTLYDEKCYDTGSMNAARIKLGRKTVKKDVQNHYDHDKDFFISFLKSYIVEALCTYFGLADLHSPPTKNIPANQNDAKDKIQDFIRTLVLARNSDASTASTVSTPAVRTIPLTVNLQNGRTVTLHIQQSVHLQQTVSQHDRVKHYGHIVLQLGLLYMNFLSICKTPDRLRMITALKYMMHAFKASNTRSKYALECLRFLAHQQSSYSLRTATESFYGLFVNSIGKLDTNEPADLKMEHTVKKLKGLYKHSGPNKMSSSLIKKSGALSGINDIAHEYDQSAKVIIRSTRHKKKSSKDEEVTLISELRTFRPFDRVLGRSFKTHTKILAPFEATLDQGDFEAWISHHKSVLTFESGK